MRAIGLVLLALFMGCTITVKPLPVRKEKRHWKGSSRQSSRHRHSTRRATENTQIVDAIWMDNYKKLELQYGHSIPADAEIKALGDKFAVPQEVMNHFSDLMRADVPYATPF